MVVAVIVPTLGFYLPKTRWAAPEPGKAFAFAFLFYFILFYFCIVFSLRLRQLLSMQRAMLPLCARTRTSWTLPSAKRGTSSTTTSASRLWRSHTFSGRPPPRRPPQLTLCITRQLPSRPSPPYTSTLCDCSTSELFFLLCFPGDCPSAPSGCLRLVRKICSSQPLHLDFVVVSVRRTNGQVVERIQHMLMRVAVGIHQVNEVKTWSKNRFVCYFFFSSFFLTRKLAPMYKKI